MYIYLIFLSSLLCSGNMLGMDQEHSRALSLNTETTLRWSKQLFTDYEFAKAGTVCILPETKNGSVAITYPSGPTTAPYHTVEILDPEKGGLLERFDLKPNIPRKIGTDYFKPHANDKHQFSPLRSIGLVPSHLPTSEFTLLHNGAVATPYCVPCDKEARSILVRHPLRALSTHIELEKINGRAPRYNAIEELPNELLFIKTDTYSLYDPVSKQEYTDSFYRTPSKIILAGEPHERCPSLLNAAVLSTGCVASLYRQDKNSGLRIFDPKTDKGYIHDLSTLIPEIKTNDNTLYELCTLADNQCTLCTNNAIYLLDCSKMNRPILIDTLDKNPYAYGILPTVFQHSSGDLFLLNITSYNHIPPYDITDGMVSIGKRYNRANKSFQCLHLSNIGASHTYNHSISAVRELADKSILIEASARTAPYHEGQFGPHIFNLQLPKKLAPKEVLSLKELAIGVLKNKSGLLSNVSVEYFNGIGESCEQIKLLRAINPPHTIAITEEEQRDNHKQRGPDNLITKLNKLKASYHDQKEIPLCNLSPQESEIYRNHFSEETRKNIQEEMTIRTTLSPHMKKFVLQGLGYRPIDSPFDRFQAQLTQPAPGIFTQTRNAMGRLLHYCSSYIPWRIFRS
jgi:hypothetical protein